MELSCVTVNSAYKEVPSTLVLGASPVSPVSQKKQLTLILMLKRHILGWFVFHYPSLLASFCLRILKDDKLPHVISSSKQCLLARSSAWGTGYESGSSCQCPTCFCRLVDKGEAVLVARNQHLPCFLKWTEFTGLSDSQLHKGTDIRSIRKVQIPKLDLGC